MALLDVSVVFLWCFCGVFAVFLWRFRAIFVTFSSCFGVLDVLVVFLWCDAPFLWFSRCFRGVFELFSSGSRVVFVVVLCLFFCGLQVGRFSAQLGGKNR